MITHLILQGENFICGHCKMIQHYLREVCHFCGYSFSNYEELLIKNYKEKNIDF